MTSLTNQHPSRDAKIKPLGELAERLSREMAGEVLFDRATRGRYSTDASIYQVTPIGVIIPRHQEDLKIALDIARDAKVPILARGAGTSQCGQTVGEALVIDTTRWLNQVVEFDAEARTVVVEPGIVLDHLNAWLKPYGLWYPVDVSTSAQCTVGGMAGNNSCGSRSIFYGNMVHNVLGVEALLADGSAASFGFVDRFAEGSQEQRLAQQVKAIAERVSPEIRDHFPKVLRRVGGYNLDLFDCQNPMPYDPDGRANLAHLLVGSEGTLGVSQRIKLRLSLLPEQKVLGVVNFPTFYQAMDFTQHIVKLGPTAVELVDRTMIELSLENPAFRPVIEKALIGKPEAILLVEFAGHDHVTQLEALSGLNELMGDLGLPGSVVDMPEAAEQKALWNVRKAGLNIMMSMKGDGKPVSFIEDCAVPLEHLAEYTDKLTEVFNRYGTEGTWYAHAGVGTLHVRPILDMRRDGAEKMREIAELASALVREYKGAYSGEHGDGICRGEWVAWQFGETVNNAFREIKQLFDPENLFNPGKIVDTPKMDDERYFRFPKSYTTIPLTPVFDWSAWNVKRVPLTGEQTPPGSGGDATHGLAMAVEMCNNNGHCRKFDAGTMCPSFRITRDEQHLTRGRANTLRLVLSGQLGKSGLASDDVKEALDLCVSCKGCKRDCPTGVDMAKFKIEARTARARANGLSLRDRMVGEMPRYAPWASKFSALVNGVERVPFLAKQIKQALKLAPQRSLPLFNGNFLASAEASQSSFASEREVLLFVDTFNNYMEGENAKAAKRVLEAAGYRVHLNITKGQRPLCCGRTYLSSGQFDKAKAEAKRTLEHLMPFVERGVAIVGLEPSCLLTMRDEFLQYGFGEEAKALSSSAYLFEEFLVKARAEDQLLLELKPLHYDRALLHGHCHQKAFDALRPVEQVLGWIPDLNVETIESSCCGMAGSFGYEAEHYDASLKMAELSLLPAIRKADSNAVLIADGTSCRHQIHDGSGREAIHVARLLEQALA
ncbi:FAD-binding protein [Halomonas sp. ATBC28]|uniref:FAD-binding and (Fe-S)-binding domain-containing protein n=1 Tax=Halomonadaceae TaxID=28256 RepID=UPI000487A840|nr:MULTISPECIES: FAD-binding and (Fe-S)-binding domain-containing protein [Halomonas]NAO95738.1 FAD-binding protein [Halomonas sp. MG34]QGQ71335.1 FAD-binding protein [Halomonas sp. PA16-9]MCD1585262.1 FAD-binding protein [Halomonas sp. IOP_14]PKH61635.1 FAD-binding oxidoreductase [Halomonas sp. Choline-3u-9]TMU26377.1 FAD-binding protein [Halomonas sp. ATBC28]